MKCFKSGLLACVTLLLFISCRSANDELLFMQQNGKYGYIDRAGKIVINPQFENADAFYEGLASVRANGLWGYIDSSGSFVIKPQFDYGRRFSEGMAVVEIGGKSGYIDKSGQIVIQPQFGRAGTVPPVVGDFSDGLALIKFGEFQNYSCGFIDRTGKFVINPTYQEASSFSEGLAVVKIGNKWGYIDKSGKYVIPPQFDSAGGFSEGLASVTACASICADGKSHCDCREFYVDRTGKQVFAAGALGLWSGRAFHEGLAVVTIQGKDGFIDREGKVVIAPQFHQAFEFSDGVAAVSIGGKYGYIDKVGKIVISPQFDMANSFSGGVGRVSINQKGIGYINKSGAFIWDPTH